APSPDEPIIIVGGGLAGLSAALEALSRNAKVIIIDGEKHLGGNSAKASSGMSAAETSTQKDMGIEDSRALFYKDTMAAGDRENDEGLVDILVDQSADAVEFLKELGVNLSDINLCGGHSTPRTHWLPSPKEGRPTPVGLGIIMAAKQRISDIAKARPDDVTIHTDTRVVGLTSWNAYVNGVNVIQDGKRKEINGKAVILATGGFSADRNEDASLLHEFASDKESQFQISFSYVFQPLMVRLLVVMEVKMARAMGAQVVGMDRVQIHPTAFVDPADPSAGTKFLAAEALRGKGAILINSEGVRFANELGRRDYLTDRILKDCKPIEKFQGGSAGLSAAIMLMNDEAADSFGRPAFNFYASFKKFFTKYNSAKELADALGIQPNVLEQTLTDYNKYVKSSTSGTKDSFGKAVFPVAIEPDQPIYAAIITPAIHYTMGGLKIDKQVRKLFLQKQVSENLMVHYQARVQNEFMNQPFKGLLAAGEVTGGVHGANRLAGNSLLECVVFGRIAGRTAAGTNYSHEEL
ncbi:flavocytochrome c, partial [Cooperia oncophora]